MNKCNHSTEHYDEWYGCATCNHVISEADIESEEFYNLMQTYRHAEKGKQAETLAAFNAIKDYLRGVRQ